jgi:O-Antigen ligase.
MPISFPNTSVPSALAPKSIFLVKLRSRATALLLIVPVFLEAKNLSVFIAGVRIRAVMIIEILLLGLLALFVVRSLSLKAKMPPLLNLLLIYLGVNALSLINAPSFSRGISILILLISLVLLYVLVLKILDTVPIFDFAFKSLLVVGLAEICFGLYQVAVGMLQHYVGITLWSGYAGNPFGNYIQAPWGRPYGTFVEPDWYGAICMVYVILFFSLLFENKVGRERRFCYIGLIASALGLFFGFVRASWIGIIIGISVYALLCRKFHIRIPKKMKAYLGIFVSIAFLLGAAFVSSGALDEIMETRFSTLNYRDPRLLMIMYSFSIFLRNPIIGNGPGCYSELGVPDVSALQKRLEGKDIEMEGDKYFDPSILTTVLSDTGIIGAVIFLLLIIAWWRHSTIFLKRMPQQWRIRCIGLFSAVCALLVSYIFSQGFWIPFTWVFLGFNIAAVELGRRVYSEESY